MAQLVKLTGHQLQKLLVLVDHKVTAEVFIQSSADGTILHGRLPDSSVVHYLPSHPNPLKQVADPGAGNVKCPYCDRLQECPYCGN